MASEKPIKEMADMLLKGARMLQYHCDKCKSPLFQKDGKVICPVCGEFKKPSKEKPKETPKLDDKTRTTLEKKRDDLLQRLEKEEDAKELSSILDSIAKIEKMLNA
ncbi:MAG: Sjogren's syndrome/scleroderma autoantigen 1 family protein [Candidatus Hydrothermarchaeales archaeon]